MKLKRLSTLAFALALFALAGCHTTQVGRDLGFPNPSQRAL